MAQDLQGKNIFIVEDSVDDVFILLTVLGKYGANVQVDWFVTGNCHKLVDALPLDLIVLDLKLAQGRTGFDLFSEIRQVPELKNIPVVAISAMDPQMAIPQTRDQGFSGFISKPININLFADQVAALIAGRKVWYSG